MIPSVLDLPTEAQTTALGAAVARALRPGEAVCLWGPLGAAKTTLARGLIRALTSPDEEVPSPTFTLAQPYEGAIPLTHFDLYRLERPEEAEELGIWEALTDGVAIIEWPERLGGRLPPDRLDIVLSLEGEGRRARLLAHGAFEGRALEL